ncbi:hypothetical protein QFZ81_000180 [Paenibacillus sp. V4I9]|uniref:hypothetical protein n=1 Tax=Paenibacillus sp. V4I9 TaxID=3042308 RepID=UPI002781E95A|nr:hypothetical protein [Paenibacillus sp. V4I9]MDQ0885092.1 hypothetical protein [Paenibacillus sp. V4I9]
MNKRIEISQQTETEVQQVIHSFWDYQYGYSRSAETREAGDSGQDYLSFLEEEGSLLFVICDGVSMSYFGDFAAKFLGDHLIDWLININEDDQSEETLQQILNQYLKEIAVRATESLKGHQIPPHIKGMLREVLAAKKEHGSGAIYGCGRIDLPSKKFPEGRILLAWQGDVRLRLWTDHTEWTTKLGDRFYTHHQWNSTCGPVGGMPHVFCETLRDWGSQGSILLYSDGLKALNNLERISGKQLQLTLTKEGQNPSSDDMSVFHVRWDTSLFKTH